MILITGATGNFGSSTAQYLQQKKIPFRAAARSLEALKKRFGSKTDLTTFDWDKPETFAGVLKGITTVYIAPPPLVTSDFHTKAKPFIEAAKRASVKHIVISTALYSDNPDSIFYGTEALVKSSGIDFTIIRPSFVFQNFLNQFLQSVRNGVIIAPSEKGKTSYVDIRNVGEAAAVVLQNPSAHKGKIYAITGRKALTHNEMAEIFSKHLSKQVVHVSPSVDDYKNKLTSLNVPDFLRDFLAQLYGTIAKGQWERVTNDYTLLTGKEATTFAEFVKEYQPFFSETPGKQKIDNKKPDLNKLNKDRTFFNNLGNIYPADATVATSSEQIAGVTCYWFVPAAFDDGKIIFYLHGGLFGLGSIQSHKPMVSHFASSLFTKVLFIEYALAPEKPFPNGLNDVLKVYRELVRKYAKAKICFIGDSAGGGLAVSLVKMVTQEKLREPSCVILISPWLYLTCETESHESRKKMEQILTKDMLVEYANYYVADNSWTEADPSRLNFDTFPPLFILVGSNEILYDDSKLFYRKIKPFQSHAKIKEFVSQNHVWLLADIKSEASKKALADISEFIAETTNR